MAHVKKEFKPVLEPGILEFNINQIDRLLKPPFPLSSKRELLYDKLINYIKRLNQLGVPFKIWIDGSFCTVKTEPNDIDMVVEMEKTAVDSLDSEKRETLLKLLNNQLVKAIYNCDVYFVCTDDDVMMSYWRGWFGFCRDQKTAKGFVKFGANYE